jgi:hypothetical protein
MGIPSMVYADIGDIFSKFQPSITAQEEYNSNINLTSTNRKEDFVTTVYPGLRFSTLPRSPTTGQFRQVPTAEEKFGMDLDFRAGFVFYAKEHEGNYISLNGTLNAWYALTQTLNFRVRDYLIRSDDIREPDYSPTAIQGEYLPSRTMRRVPWIRNVFEPSVEYRFGRENTLGINYRNNIYEIKSQQFGDSQENYINPKLNYWFDIRNGISLEYGLTLGDFEQSPDLVGHMATGRYTYRFNPRTSVFGEYTFLRRDFDFPGVDYDVYRPSLGIEHAFSPTLSGRVQAGYYWQNPARGSTTNGYYYDVSFTQSAQRTSYTISFQGGYTEDYFTAENLGFTKYHRAIGTITHQVMEKIAVGLRSSFELAKSGGGERDRIWGIGGNASYQALRWLVLSLDVSHRENHSDISDRDYSEYSGIFRITATY